LPAERKQAGASSQVTAIQTGFLLPPLWDLIGLRSITVTYPSLGHLPDQMEPVARRRNLRPTRTRRETRRYDSRSPPIQHRDSDTYPRPLGHKFTASRVPLKISHETFAIALFEGNPIRRVGSVTDLGYLYGDHLHRPTLLFCRQVNFDGISIPPLSAAKEAVMTGGASLPEVERLSALILTIQRSPK